MFFSRLAQFFLIIWLLIFSTGATSIGLIPIKVIVMALYISAGLLYLFTNHKLKIKFAITLLGICSWIFIELFVGILNGYDLSATSQAGSVLTGMFFVFVTFILYQNDAFQTNKIVNAIYLTALLGMLIRIFLAFSIYTETISVELINELMQSFFGAPGYIASTDYGIFPGYPRIGSSSDLIYIIIFLFYAVSNSRFSSFILWFITLLFVSVCNSRYMMLVFGGATSYLIYSYLLKSYTRRLGFIVLTVFVLLSFEVLGFTELFDILQSRFTGGLQEESDSIRAEQAMYLFNLFADNPIFGTGMGGYATNYVRSDIHFWHYELEYLAMLMQFGILGFIFIVLMYVWYALSSILNDCSQKMKIPMWFSFFCWLVTPLQSSIFIGTTSSFALISIYFLTRRNLINS